MGIHKITMPYRNITASMTEMNGTSPTSVLWQNRIEGEKLFLMADGSTKQNRLIFYQLEVAAGTSLLSSSLSSSLSAAAYGFPNTPGVTGTNRAGGGDDMMLKVGDGLEIG